MKKTVQRLDGLSVGQENDAPTFQNNKKRLYKKEVRKNKQATPLFSLSLSLSFSLSFHQFLVCSHWLSLLLLNSFRFNAIPSFSIWSKNIGRYCIVYEAHSMYRLFDSSLLPLRAHVLPKFTFFCQEDRAA